jgi:beta-lactamase regulating signal transducer with metallopeptidase domain
MSDFAIDLLSALGRTTLWLALVGAITAALLRLARAHSPTVHRVGCVLTLLVGWAFLRYPVAVPWYEVAAATPDSVALPPTPLVPIELEPAAIASSDNSSSIQHDQIEVVDLADLPNPSTAQQPAILQNLPTAEGQGPIESNWLSDIVALLPLVAAALWALGVFALPVIWLVGYVRFVRSLRACRPPADAWQSQWSELIASQSVGTPIPLCVTDEVGPMLCRLPRGYVLVVPEPLWRELSDEGRRAILRHELAHYQRGDVWKSLAVRLLALPHWFNPVSWWAVRRFDEAAEWACDAAASADQPSTEYAKTLVRLGEMSTTELRYGSAARGRTLAVRVRRVLDMRARPDSALKQVFALGIVLAIGLASLLNVRLVARERTADVQESPSAKTETNVKPDEQPLPGGTDVNGKTTEQPGPTVSPDLNLLQIGPDPAKKDTVGKTSVKPDEPGMDQELAAKDAVNEAANKMVKQAERAFEATQAAYDAETASLGALYDWSLRWMRAAQNAAPTPKENVAAAQAHLKRMRGLQKRIHLLYFVGTRGGDAKDEAAANYYVAEAERIVAEAEAAYKKNKASSSPTQATSVEQHVSDAKIAVAVDEAELRTTEIRLQEAKEKLDLLNRAKRAQPGAISAIELAHADAEVKVLEAALQKLNTVRNLHQENLKRLQASAGSSPALTSRAAKAPSTPADPASSEQQISDAKIALAVDEAEMSAAEIRMQVAKEKLADGLRSPNVFGKGVVAERKAEVQLIEAELKKLQSVRVLHEQNLARLLAADQQHSAERPATAEPDRKLAVESQRKLLYAGKTFEQWAEQLRTDLSPESRVQALRALLAFGMHGLADEAVETVLRATLNHGFKAQPTLEANPLETAAEVLAGLPAEIVLPRVTKLMKNSDPDQRLFAIKVIQGSSIPWKEKEGLLSDLINDPNVEVSHLMIQIWLDANPNAPQVISKLRELLTSPEPSQVIFAAQAVLQLPLRRGGQSFRDSERELLTTMMPDILNAMGRGDPIHSVIQRSLLMIPNKDKLPALKTALQSDDLAVGERAEELIQKIEGKQTRR